MTFEEMERTMQFILEQQAQLSVNMEKAEERRARAGERMAEAEAKAEERLAKAEAKAEERRAESDERIAWIEGIQENTARQIEYLGNALVALTEAHEQTREELAKSHARTMESLSELAEAQAQTQGALKGLAESQAHSDRRLDALIDIVRGGKDTGQST